MDGQRFDELTRTMAAGASRRRVLRLAGGGLAAALGGVLARGDRAAAEPGGPGERPQFTYCYSGPGGVEWDSGPFYEGESDALPCGGNEDCPPGKVCVTAVNPANRIVCRCIDLTRL